MFQFNSPSDFNSDFIKFHDHVFAQQPFILIVVAPKWCGHCIAMEADLQKFMQAEQKTKENIVYFTDEAYDHLVSSHGDNKVAKTLKSVVSGYPSIAAVKAKQDNAINVHEMDEPRTKAGLDSFKKKHLKKALKEQMRGKVTRALKTKKPKVKPV